MSEFDPDKALAELESGQIDMEIESEDSVGFDPDAALSELEAQQPIQEETSLVEDVADVAGDALGLAEAGVEKGIASARRFASGAVPFINSMSAAVNASIDPLTDKVADKIFGESPTTVKESWGQRFNRNLETIREVEQEDIETLGQPAALALEAGGMILGLGKATKALGLAGKSGKLAKVSNVALDTAYVLTRESDKLGFGRESLNTAGWSAMFSTAIHTVGGPVGKLAKGAGRGIIRGVESLDNKVFNSAIQSTMKATKESIEAFTTKHSPEVMERIAKKVGMESAEVAENYAVLNNNINKSLNETGDALKEAWSDADRILGTGTINPSNLVDDLERTLNSLPESEQGLESMRPFLDDLASFFKNQSTGEYKVKSVKQLNDILLDMNSGAANPFRKLSSFEPAFQEKVKATVFGNLRGALKRERKSLLSGLKYKKAVGEGLDPKMGFNRNPGTTVADASKAVENYKTEIRGLQQAIDNYVPTNNPKLDKIEIDGFKAQMDVAASKLEAQSKIVTEAANVGVTPAGAADAASKLESGVTIVEINSLSKKIDDLSREYFETADFRDMVVGSAKKATKTTGGGFMPYLKGLMQRSPLVAAGGAVGGVQGAATAFFAQETVGRTVSALARAAGTTNDAVLRKTLQKTINGMNILGRMNADPFARTLGIEAARVMDDKEILPDEAWSKLNSVFSKAELYEMPLDRTTEAATANFEKIMDIAAEVNPEIATQLSNALASKSDIGPSMDAISKMPGMDKFIRPGMGWDNKVYTKEDKAAAVARLNDYPLLSTNDRMLQKNNIEKTGNLPEWDALPQRQPRKLIPSDKGKGDY